jgi:hypothetical protein
MKPKRDIKMNENYADQPKAKPFELALQEMKILSMHDKINDTAARHFEPLAGEKSDHLARPQAILICLYTCIPASLYSYVL